MYLLALSALWLQGPSSGSPFKDAPLPFDELKAPPDTAFDILMASLAMVLLSAIAAGIFLAVSKLGAIEALLKKESAKARDDAAEREARMLEVLRTLSEGQAPASGGPNSEASGPAELG